MQKVTDFLEQNVQWIAIGLGVLFVLFMTWSYVLTPPAQVELGNEPRTAGEVDEYTATTVAQELEGKIKENVKITMTVPDYDGAFKSAMAWKDAAPINLASGWNSQTIDVTVPGQEPAPGTTPPTPGPGQQLPPDAIAKVTELPKPPPATPAESKFGRSVVIIPPDPNNPAAAVQPVMQPVPGQPGQSLGVDRDWVTQMFTLDLAKLDDEFKRTRIPTQFAKTVFLQVEMQRQEIDADGKPIEGTEKIVPAVALWRANAPPPPFPEEGADRALAAQYLQWASANTPDIIQPQFYVVEKGNQWTKPGEQINPLAMFDPAAHVGGKGTLTDAQWEMVLKVRAEKTKAEAAQRKQAAPPPRPPVRGRPGRGEGGAPGSDVMYAPARAPAAPPYRPPYMPGSDIGAGAMGLEGGDMEGAYGGYGQYGAAGPVAVNLPQPNVDYPAGEFDPAAWRTKTIEIWAHDTSVEAGKTYRYRMRYKMKSPVFGNVNLTEPQELADQFAIVSDWSEWSQPKDIPPLVNFYVASGKARGSSTVRFQVFRWHEGQQKSEIFAAGPGDQVGGKKGDIDYSTGYTVVDLRDDPRTGSDDAQILLLDPDGKIHARSFSTDQSDPMYKGLKELVDQQKLAEAGVAAGNGTPIGR